MTIITKKGNLLDAKGIIVHGCNCQGVMGSGVALAIKNKWPKVYEEYRRNFDAGLLKLGNTHLVTVARGVFVVNAMTQDRYGRDGRRYVNYEAVARAFEFINLQADDLADESCGPSVNFPLLGAGLGGGDWEIISTIIDRTLGDDIEKILWVQ